MECSFVYDVSLLLSKLTVLVVCVAISHYGGPWNIGRQRKLSCEQDFWMNLLSDLTTLTNNTSTLTPIQKPGDELDSSDKITRNFSFSTRFCIMSRFYFYCKRIWKLLVCKYLKQTPEMSHGVSLHPAISRERLSLSCNWADSFCIDACRKRSGVGLWSLKGPPKLCLHLSREMRDRSGRVWV